MSALEMFGLKSSFPHRKLQRSEQRFTGQLTRPDGSVENIDTEDAYVSYDREGYIQVVGVIGPKENFSWIVFNIPESFPDGEYSTGENGLVVAGPLDSLLLRWEGKASFYRRDRLVLKFSGKAQGGYEMKDLSIVLRSY